MKTRELVLDHMEDVNPWAVLGDDTTGLEISGVHASGKFALHFNKVDSAADTVFAGMYRAVQLDFHRFGPQDKICWLVNIPDLTNVTYTFLRLGDDAANYVDGWDQSEVVYMAVGVAFGAEDNALANMYVDQAFIASFLFTP